MQRIEPESFVCATCGKNFFPYENCGKIDCENRSRYGETFYSRGTGYLRIKARLGSYGNTGTLNIAPYSTVRYLLDKIFEQLLLDKQPLPSNCKIFFLLRDEVIESGPVGNWNIQRFAIRDRDMIVVRMVDVFTAQEVIWNPVYKSWMTPKQNKHR